MDKHMICFVCCIHGIFVYLCYGINELGLYEIDKLACLLQAWNHT